MFLVIYCALVLVVYIQDKIEANNKSKEESNTVKE